MLRSVLHELRAAKEPNDKLAYRVAKAAKLLKVDHHGDWWFTNPKTNNRQFVHIGSLPSDCKDIVSSIDAALALCEYKLPNWIVESLVWEQKPDENGRLWVCRLRSKRTQSVLHACGSTAPFAILITMFEVFARTGVSYA